MRRSAPLLILVAGLGLALYWVVGAFGLFQSLPLVKQIVADAGLVVAAVALVMLVVGGMQAYTVVWDLGDVGIGLMTIFNMLALYPLSGEALTALREYEAKKKLK